MAGNSEDVSGLDELTPCQWYAYGDLLENRGKSDAALAAYKLGCAKANVIECDAYLVTGHDRIAVLMEQAGDLSAAIASFENSLALTEIMLGENPGDEQLQRDVAICHDSLGRVHLRAGNIVAARAAYEASLAISEQLVAVAPDEMERKRDVLICYNNLGDAAVEQGDLPAARGCHERALTIAEQPLGNDPENTRWQRDITICHFRLGDMAMQEHDFVVARSAYEASLAIRQRLFSADPENEDRQIDLVSSYDKMYSLCVAEGDPVGARLACEAALPIEEKMASTEMDNNAFLYLNVLFRLQMIGDLIAVDGNDNALPRYFETGLARVIDFATSNDLDSYDLAKFSSGMKSMGNLLLKFGNMAAALDIFQAGLALDERLHSLDPQNVTLQYALDTTRKAMSDLESTNQLS